MYDNAKCRARNDSRSKVNIEQNNYECIDSIAAKIWTIMHIFLYKPTYDAHYQVILLMYLVNLILQFSGHRIFRILSFYI